MQYYQTIDLSDFDNFLPFFMRETALCVTLKPRPPNPTQLKDDTLINGHFSAYCARNNITYYFQREEAGQTHFHGLMDFPTGQVRKNFVKWYNRAYGSFGVSNKTAPYGWYTYVHKDVPVEEYVEVIDPIDQGVKK